MKYEIMILFLLCDTYDDYHDGGEEDNDDYDHHADYDLDDHDNHDDDHDDDGVIVMLPAAVSESYISPLVSIQLLSTQQ